MVYLGNFLEFRFVFCILKGMAKTLEHHENKDESSSRTEETTYLTWESPGWVYKQRDKEFYRNIGAILFFLFVILIVIQEYILVVAVLSIVFVIYVLSTVPPPLVKHRVTNRGLESAGRFYRWEEFTEFWFEERWNQKLVVIQPRSGPRLMLLVGSQKQEVIQQALQKELIFRTEPEKNIMDKASGWLSEKLPLDKPAS